MSDLNENIEVREMLQSAFQNYHIQADEKVWQGIEAAITPKKNRAIIWLRFAAAASITVVISISGYWFNSTKEVNKLNHTPFITSENVQQKLDKNRPEPSNKVTSKQITTNTKEITEEKPALIATKNEVVSTTSLKKNNSKMTVEPAEYSDLSINISAHLSQDDTIRNSENILENTKNNSIANIDSSSDMEKTESKLAVKSAEKPLDVGMEMPEEMTNNKQNWVLAANFQTASEKENQQAELSSATHYKNTLAGVPVPLSDTEASSRSNIRFQEREFAAPIRTSVTVKYDFNEKWNIEGGLSYALFNINQKSVESSIKKAEIEEQLHYIGFPVLINYNFIAKRKVTSFISSGLLFEKGIRQTSKFILEGETEEVTNSSVKGLQYAFIFGVGLEYHISNLIGVFIQPSVTLNSATKTQPFDLQESDDVSATPNLRMGLRFHLNRK